MFGTEVGGTVRAEGTEVVGGVIDADVGAGEGAGTVAGGGKGLGCTTGGGYWEACCKWVRAAWVY
jgi:hypothetical protein